jgi:Fur family ferric uptake transcriptional regulator
MVCVDTGKTIEFYDPEIEKKQDDIAASNGYEIVDRSSVIFVKKTD